MPSVRAGTSISSIGSIVSGRVGAGRAAAAPAAQTSRIADTISRNSADGTLIAFGVLGTAALGGVGVYKALNFTTEQAAPGWFKSL